MLPFIEVISQVMSYMYPSEFYYNTLVNFSVLTKTIPCLFYYYVCTISLYMEKQIFPLGSSLTTLREYLNPLDLFISPREKKR